MAQNIRNKWLKILGINLVKNKEKRKMGPPPPLKHNTLYWLSTFTYQTRWVGIIKDSYILKRQKYVDPF